MTEAKFFETTNIGICTEDGGGDWAAEVWVYCPHCFAEIDLKSRTSSYECSCGKKFLLGLMEV